MRHQKSFNHLGRTTPHRKAMLSNMASSLIMHKKINTTIAKAKALRSYVEPLITKAKNDTTHSRRMVFKLLQDKEAVTELFREVSQKVGDREGGYTRILKTGKRLGDNADMCLIELVDYNENLLKEKKKAKSTTRRRRSSGAKKTETPVEKAEEVVAEATEVVEEAKVEEAKVEEVVEKVAEVEAKVEKAAEDVVEKAKDAAKEKTDDSK